MLIRAAVVLHGGATLVTIFDCGYELVPSVRLRHRYGDRHAHLAKSCDGFRSASYYGKFSKGVGERFGRMTRGDYFGERAGAYTGEQDHHLEFAGEEAFGESEGFVVGVERSFAHAGSDEGIAALTTDQLGDLGAAPAFERDDAQAIKRHPGT